VGKGWGISPLKLKLNAEINKANAVPFDSLFGVFAYSLNDVRVNQYNVFS
jgi:hypothetical protein